MISYIVKINMCIDEVVSTFTITGCSSAEVAQQRLGSYIIKLFETYPEATITSAYIIPSGEDF